MENGGGARCASDPIIFHSDAEVDFKKEMPIDGIGMYVKVGK